LKEKSHVLEKISEIGLLAVIRGPNEDLTLRLVEALIMGGVTGIEITYTTPNAEDVVKNIDQRFRSDVLLGMGTLTDPNQAVSAKGAGAKFLVSPIVENELIGEMVSSGLVTMAGALSPSEIFSAYKNGVDIVKVFPGSLGGPNYFKALKGPFPQIPLMPTGGVSLENIPEWFGAGAFAVGVGSELCPKQLVVDQKFKEITDLAKKFRDVVIKSRG